MHFLSSAQAAAIADQPSPHEVAASEIVWSGRIVDMVEDHVVVVEGQEPVVRQYTRHPGAVAVVAMRGEAGAEEILMERQYRHPVQATLWEIPAGLLDIPGEDPLLAAERELAEEADMKAGRWEVLVDFLTSPGGTNEPLRVFLARDLEATGSVFDREVNGTGRACGPLTLRGCGRHPSLGPKSLDVWAVRHSDTLFATPIYLNWRTLIPREKHTEAQ